MKGESLEVVDIVFFSFCFRSTKNRPGIAFSTGHARAVCQWRTIRLAKQIEERSLNWLPLHYLAGSVGGRLGLGPLALLLSLHLFHEGIRLIQVNPPVKAGTDRGV